MHIIYGRIIIYKCLPAPFELFAPCDWFQWMINCFIHSEYGYSDCDVHLAPWVTLSRCCIVWRRRIGWRCWLCPPLLYCPLRGSCDRTQMEAWFALFGSAVAAPPHDRVRRHRANRTRGLVFSGTDSLYKAGALWRHSLRDAWWRHRAEWKRDLVLCNTDSVYDTQTRRGSAPCILIAGLCVLHIT